MKKSIKKWVSFLSVGAIALSTVFNSPTGEVYKVEKAKAAVTIPADTNDVITPENPALFRDLSSEEMIKEMGAGWNLGNTFDGHTGLTPSETAWQPVTTTKETIKQVHDMGFNTVRIPVTWGNMINEDFSVRETWMNRVQDVVDYCIEQDMYVILNMHHDGAEAMYWFNLKLEGEELEQVWTKFRGLWTTIAERFKNYDEHLIFESMNEVQGGRWDQEEAGTQFGVNINTANQIFVDTIRSTGSNNSKRWLSIPPWGTRIAVTLNADKYGFRMPTDTLEEPRLMLAVHDYAPVNKCLNGTSREDNDITLTDVIECYESNFIGLNEQYVSNGIPVILGEYGAVDKDNTPKRELYCEAVNILAKKHKIVGVYWDDGGVDNNAFALVDREKHALREGYEGLSYALMRGFFTSTDINAVTAGTQLVPITGFNTEESVMIHCNDSVEVTVSGVQPANHNDVILWKTENPYVATVYNGMIRGRSVGETVVTAYTQNGQVAKQINVTVKEQEGTTCDNITVGVDESDVKVYMGYGTFLNASVGTADCQASLRYYSEDESVAVVSCMGKVTGVKQGSTNIVIVSSTGFTKTIPVTVEAAPWDYTKFRLALHIYYNDTEHEFFDDVMSTDIITVDGPGEYYLKFDCATDLTSRAKEAGINTINNAGAIYLKDVDVDEGKISKSILKSGNISYQKILINGVDIAVADAEKAFPLVKSNHIIDTNNPINSWGDYAIVEDEVNVSNNQITYKEVAEPTVIEIYFTVSDMYYDNGILFPSADGGKPSESEPTLSPTLKPTASPEATVAPTNAVSPAPVESPKADVTPAPETSVTPLEKGMVISDDTSKAQYKITNLSETKKTVSYVKPNAKKAAVSVPATVKIQGETFKVTEIAKKAFYKDKKIKKVTIGKNITKIGDKAFYGCKSLKKVTIKSKKISKVGKKAFGDTSKKLKFLMPKSKQKKYKKLIG